jgi:hypothetical protein
MDENKLRIANGSPFTHFTYEEKAIAASATNIAKGAAGSALVNAGDTVAQ